MKAILTRRSIRKFTGEHIPNEDVSKLLKAAMVAPSACNQQPWHFVVVCNKKSQELIMKAHSHADMLKEASLAILVCADPELQTCPGYWVQDVSAATMNILLAAHALGYGATWCGVYPHDDRVWKLKELFNLPKQVIPLNVIAIGVPDETKPAAERYKEERVHHEKW